MRKTKRVKATTRLAKDISGKVGYGLLLIVVVLAFAIIYVLRPTNNAGSQNSVPPKPGGTPISSTTASGNWHLPYGLPKNITNLAFSSQKPAQGYVAAFVNKQQQAIYKTTDQGTNWQLASTVQAPVADIVATDPTDSQDVVLVSLYAPTAGKYTIRRSYDGGQTWQQQDTTMPSSATVSRTGWEGSSFLIGFSLDRQPTGDSALVAFPAHQQSSHLDVDGKINGISIPYIQLLTGHGNKLQVWGLDDTKSSNIIGLATTDMGKSWTTISSTYSGQALLPMASTNDGNTLLATTKDHTHLAVSKDAGNSWAAHPSPNGDTIRADKTVFVSPNGEGFVHVTSNVGPGIHGNKNGQWVKASDKDIIAISADTAGHVNKLWAYDDQGQLVWLDF